MIPLNWTIRALALAALLGLTTPAAAQQQFVPTAGGGFQPVTIPAQPKQPRQQPAIRLAPTVSGSPYANGFVNPAVFANSPFNNPFNTPFTNPLNPIFQPNPIINSPFIQNPFNQNPFNNPFNTNPFVNNPFNTNPFSSPFNTNPYAFSAYTYNYSIPTYPISNPFPYTTPFNNPFANQFGPNPYTNPFVPAPNFFPQTGIGRGATLGGFSPRSY